MEHCGNGELYDHIVNKGKYHLTKKIRIYEFDAAKLLW